AAVLPLSKKLSDEASDVWAELRKHFPVDFDESQSIGKRYRRQDEIGTRAIKASVNTINFFI
ncbi:MAG TPA: His/Gly/Thr/Pro-type tRNA ligase C-terminal domain-containing protein, partial [Erysipelothrix sp.]